MAVSTATARSSLPLLHQQAVDAMMRGDWVRASAGFHAALSHLKTHGRGNDDASSAHGAVRVQLLDLDCATTRRFSPHNVFQVYPGVMTTTIHDASSFGNDEVTAVAFLYNFGLALHLHGLHSARHVLLRKAMRVYEIALTTLTAAATTTTTTTTISEEGRQAQFWRVEDAITTATASLYNHLQLALWTNLGHLYSHFYMHEHALTVAESIVDILSLPHTRMESLHGELGAEDGSVPLMSHTQILLFCTQASILQTLGLPSLAAVA